MVDFTYSTLKKFLDCPRKYKLNQIDGYHSRRRSVSVTRGIVGHEAMEIRQKEGIEEAINHIRNKIFRLSEKDFDREGEAKVDLSKLQAELIGAVTHFPKNIAIDKNKIEFQFNVPFIASHRLRGKIDGQLKNKNTIFDYKFTGAPQIYSDPELLKLNLQANLYSWATDADEFIFFPIKNCLLRHKKTETLQAFLTRVRNAYGEKPKDYFDQCSFKIDKSYLNGVVMTNIINVMKLIDHCFQIGKWPMNQTACLTTFNRKCTYVPICTEEYGWEDYYDVKGPNYHPELEEEEC